MLPLQQVLINPLGFSQAFTISDSTQENLLQLHAPYSKAKDDRWLQNKPTEIHRRKASTILGTIWHGQLKKQKHQNEMYST